MEISKEGSFFNLTMCRSVTSNAERTEVVVKIEKGGEEIHTVIESDSAIGALYGALRKGLKNFYPELSSLRLVQYSELHEKDEIRAIAISTDGEKSWSTWSVSGKDSQARLQAIIGAFEHKLKRKGVEGDGSLLRKLS